MERPTFITGSWQPSPQAKARDVTIRHDGKRYLATTVRDALIDPTLGVWRTLAKTRKAAKSTVRQDRRFSANGPSMFAVGPSHLLTRSGKPKGSPMSFEAFVAHMLKVSGDGTWGSETRADREADAAAVLRQRSWSSDDDVL